VDDAALWQGDAAAARGALISDCEFRIAKWPKEKTLASSFSLGRHHRHNRSMKKELESRTKKFALRVIKLVNALPRSRVANVLANQILRSGTSIGANYREANRAQSREDFIHKIAVCEKEADETEYWLELLVEAKLIKQSMLDPLIAECRELLAIFVTSGRTAKRRRSG
jgi:four helix bundle protein